jgi:hypothetical protein
MTVARASMLSLACVLAVAAPTLAAAPYPTNTCVSAKQKAAGKYCKSALLAWSKWESSQDAVKRDASLASAQAKLDTSWGKAEEKSLAKGVDCTQTTVPSSASGALIDDHIDDIVTIVNMGLDLGDKDDAKCGAAIVKAAGIKCAKFLTAESKRIKDPSKDPGNVKRDAAKAKASAKFSDTFAKQLAAGCPTSATESDIELRVDTTVSDTVEDTVISPFVDDTQFTTIAGEPVEYQGRTFTPICMEGSDYSFFVKRGSVNKLVMYYQGGGACWEQLTCAIPVCDPNVDSGDDPNGANTGFADVDNPNNPFRDWNIVFVSYCSCDIHFGDAEQTYTNQNPNNPTHVLHRGYHNSRVVEKWAREHFVDPEEVFVTGSSAGAYGAWFNAPLHHEVWPGAHFDVLADAGNGVITQQFLEQYFPNWNFIGNLPKEFPEIKEIIETGGGIPEYTEFVAGEFPDTNWAHYSSAYDGGTGGQTGFYNVMLNNNNPIAALSWWDASCAFNEKMRDQAIATAAVIPDNYRYYIGTGSRHTMWGSNKVYTDTTGGVPTLVDWVNAMLIRGPGWTNVECTNCGLLLPGDPRPNPLEAPFEQQGSDVVIDCSGSPSGAFLD